MVHSWATRKDGKLSLNESVGSTVQIREKIGVMLGPLLEAWGNEGKGEGEWDEGKNQRSDTGIEGF